jgi:hypothetical protein
MIEVDWRVLSRTKKQYVWRLNLDGQDFTIELFTSKLSGKKKVVVNGEVKLDDKA